MLTVTPAELAATGRGARRPNNVATEAASATMATAPARRRSRYRTWFPLPDTIPPVAYPAPGTNAQANTGSDRQRGDHCGGHLVGRRCPAEIAGEHPCHDHRVDRGADRGRAPGTAQ